MPEVCQHGLSVLERCAECAILAQRIRRAVEIKGEPLNPVEIRAATRGNATKPALTAEEWESGYVGRVSATLSIEPHHSGGLWIYLLDEGPDGSDASVELTPEDRAALAAFALRGMPFGFTHEDLALLDEATNYGAFDQDRIAQLRSIIDRIAALLPPENPNA